MKVYNNNKPFYGFLLFLYAFSALGTGQQHNKDRFRNALTRLRRVVFGDSLDKDESFVVGLVMKDEFRSGLCSGALVAKRWIVTALHCVSYVNYNGEEGIIRHFNMPLSVYLDQAEIKWTKPSSISVLNMKGSISPNVVEHIEKFNVDSTILRGHYEKVVMRRCLPQIDIVMLRLKSNWDPDGITKPIALPHPTKMLEPPANKNLKLCNAAGYGCSEMFRRLAVTKKGVRKEKCSSRCNSKTLTAAKAEIDVDLESKCLEQLMSISKALKIEPKGENYTETIICWKGKPLLGNSGDASTKGVESRCATSDGDSGGPVYCRLSGNGSPVLYGILSMASSTVVFYEGDNGKKKHLSSSLGDFEFGVRMTEFVKWIQYTVHDYREKLLKNTTKNGDRKIIKAENTVQLMCCDNTKNKCFSCELK